MDAFLVIFVNLPLLSTKTLAFKNRFADKYNSCIPDKILCNFSPVLTNLILHTFIQPGVVQEVMQLYPEHVGSWRHCNVTYNINYQYDGCQRIGMWLVNGDCYVKINAMNVRDNNVCKKKNLS